MYIKLVAVKEETGNVFWLENIRSKYCLKWAQKKEDAKTKFIVEKNLEEMLEHELGISYR